MKAIEIISKTDINGHLKIDYPLNKSESAVRVIILLDDKNIEASDEKLWAKAISQNPAFEYLKDKEEDVYTVNDGESFYG